MRRDILNRVRMHELRIQSRVIQDRSEMDHGRQRRHRSRLPEILMPDDGLADGFALGELGAEAGEDVEGDEASFEFEREVSGRLVAVGTPDVVQERRE
ncbi:hypothetical protein NU219Hw_g1913t1 [Hortaea werneckii]